MSGLEDVLAAHWEIDVDNSGDQTEFFCDGCKMTLLVGVGEVDAAHRAHVAAAIREWLLSGEVVERATRAAAAADHYDAEQWRDFRDIARAALRATTGADA